MTVERSQKEVKKLRKMAMKMADSLLKMRSSGFKIDFEYGDRTYDIAISIQEVKNVEEPSPIILLN